MVIGVAQLKARLSEHLARVRAGDEVLVTDHGRPIARIVPVADEHERLGELERQGLVRPGSMKLPDGFRGRPRPKVSGPTLTETLVEERRQGR
jgi:prevent-host-death family protein